MTFNKTVVAVIVAILLFLFVRATHNKSGFVSDAQRSELGKIADKPRANMFTVMKNKVPTLDVADYYEITRQR